MPRPDDFYIHELAQALQGTCTTIQEHLPDGMDEIDLLPADHDVIDNEIFLCDVCGWWFEICEQAEGENDLCESCIDSSSED